MASLLANLWSDRRGQDMTEYALIAGLLAAISVAIVPEMIAVAGHMNTVLLTVTRAAAEMASLN